MIAMLFITDSYYNIEVIYLIFLFVGLSCVLCELFTFW